jgi:hypothetical protein
MRRRAIEILGHLGSLGPGNSVMTALDAVLADNTAAVAVRCSAAEAIGRLEFPANANVPVADLSKKLGTVAAYACRDEIKRVEDQEAKEGREQGSGGPGGGMPGGMYPGGMSGGMYPGAMPGYGESGMYGGMPGGASPGSATGQFDPLGYRIGLTRRQVKYRMLLVKRGLLGPGAVTPAAAKSGPTKPVPPKPEKTEPAKPDATPPGPGQAVPGQAAPTPTGVFALAKGNDVAYLVKLIKGIDDIMAVVEGTSFKDMTALITELRGKVQKFENDCGIVVALAGEEPEAIVDQGLLENPLGIPEGIPTAPPAAGASKPATPPAKGPAQPPAKTPTEPQPATAPAEKPPAAAPASKPEPGPSAPGPAKAPPSPAPAT